MLRACRDLGSEIKNAMPDQNLDEPVQRWDSPVAARAAMRATTIPTDPERLNEIVTAFGDFRDEAERYRGQNKLAIELYLAGLRDVVPESTKGNFNRVKIRLPNVPPTIEGYFAWAKYQILKAKCQAGSIVFRRAALPKLNRRAAYPKMVWSPRTYDAVAFAAIADQNATDELLQFFIREYDRFVERLRAGSTEPPRQITDEVGEEGQVGSLVAERNSADVGTANSGPVDPPERQHADARVKTTRSRTYKAIVRLVGEKQFSITVGSDELVLRGNYTMFFGLFVCNVVGEAAAATVVWGPLNRATDPAAKNMDEKTSSARTRKRLLSLNEKFKACFGEGPPGNELGDTNWIITDKGNGAYLNPKVKWNVDPNVEKFFKGRRKGQDVDMDPSIMANTFSDPAGDADHAGDTDETDDAKQ